MIITNRRKILFTKSILNSYSSIFFSSNLVFSSILLLVTFFDFWTGLAGFLSVVVSNALAYVMGFNKYHIKCGYYGFNSLLVGLAIGNHFQPGIEFFILLFFAALLTLFLTLITEGVIGKYGLPFLSVAFLISVWLVTLATREFSALHESERGIFTLNEMYAWGGIPVVKLYLWITNLDIHESITIYFKSLGAIFFQYNIIAGVLISIGILIYSRIAFLLTLVGFFSAYFFYIFIGANINDLSYNYIGFNFILTSIAIGGFFIIPSRWSFLWVLLLTPVISILIISTTKLFAIYQLPIFSLPFNAIVLMFLYILKFRFSNFTRPEISNASYATPEMNLYSQLNNKSRFRNAHYFPFALPFFGEWTVSQAHAGEITHKGDWQHAWDFVITNNKFTYRSAGRKVEDFYSYNKPVLAPLDGWIEEVVDIVPDNEIGEVNLHQNWGNSIIIRHTNLLYTNLSHLKKGSIRVSKGDYVKKGDSIASCGSTGRSPEPHLHFQIQATPYIGSKTLDYPLAHYIVKKDSNEYEYRSFSRPKKDEVIVNIEKNKSLHKAFHFIPGQKLRFIIKENKSEREINWEVETNVYNQSYLLCTQTGAKAYFSNDGSIHYFTSYEGNKKSELFYFYLGAYKVLMGFYKGVTLKDVYPVHLLNNNGIIFLQDFIAPFYMFIKSEYQVQYTDIEDYLSSSFITLKSNTRVSIGSFSNRNIDFEIKINNYGIDRFTIIENGKEIELRSIDPNMEEERFNN